MKVRRGDLSCKRFSGDTRSGAEVYRDALEVAVNAERLGFESIWCFEHHFLAASALPSPLPLCAALAARTSRLLVGTRIADGFIATWPLFESFAEQVGWLRGELEAAGRDPAAFTFAVSVPTIASEEPGMWERVLRHYWGSVATYAVMGDQTAREIREAPLSGGGEMRDDSDPLAPVPPITAEQVAELRQAAIVGTPDEVVDQIRTFEQVAAGDGSGFHFIADIIMPGVVGSLRDEQIALFGELVLPQLASS